MSVTAAAGRAPSFLSFLKTLSFVVGLSLGLGSVFAAVWSRVFLPLLYSTFSARKAVTEQQLGQMKQVISRLRTIRSRRIYSQPPVTANSASDTSANSSPANALTAGSPRSSHGDLGPSDSLLIEEVVTEGHGTPEQRTKRAFDASGDKRDGWKLIPDLKAREDAAVPGAAAPIVPVLTLANELEPLPSRLRQLSEQMAATETTRTSLISTVNAYTSHLHTQNFLMVRASGTGSRARNAAVGLSSLDDNLRKEGAASQSTADARTRAEPEGLVGIADLDEYETVRKEIRSIKGLMLSRRGLSVG